MSDYREETRYRREFLAESEELLEQGDELLGRLLAEGFDAGPATLNALFRAVHSLKGVAGMVGLGGISSRAHAFEALLDALRLGKVAASPELAAASAAALEELRVLARRVADGEDDPAGDPALGERLLALARPASAEGETSPAPVARPRSPLPHDVDRVLSDYERHRVDESLRKGRRLVLVALEFPIEGFDEGLRQAMDAAGRIGELIGTLPGEGGADLSRISFRLLVAGPPDVSAEVLAAGCGGSAVSEAAVPVVARGAPNDGERRRPGGQVPETVRVHLDKISTLLDLAGELALARWALQRPLERLVAESGDRASRTAAMRAFAGLDRAVKALGRAALGVRLVPVEQMTGRLARTVASFAPQLGKEATFALEGGETEIDKILADELTDPFLHLVRNALDHGLETPEERTAAGKPRAGRIVLKAEARGRDVVFTLSDDGHGIDPVAIVALAREQGVLRSGDPAPEDPLELLFRPGFSTARRVSEISGRGFGLDVVRANLVPLKGSVRVSSRPGEGTTFEVTVPATLVLVEALLVRTGGLHFALPTTGVSRMLRRGGGEGEWPRGGVLFDGDNTLPLRPLAEILGLEADPTEAASGTVVVAQYGSRRAAIVVSAVDGVEDVIVRPISETVPRLPVIAGAAELPGGALALVLDPSLLLDSIFGAEAA